MAQTEIKKQRIKIIAIFAAIVISLTPAISIAQRNSTLNKAVGVMAFGTVIAMMMKTQCAEASQYMWDLEPEIRNQEFECKKWFNSFGDKAGLRIFNKEEIIAKKSYSKLKKALLTESVAAGGSPEPPEDCDAHHIVPENENRPFAQPYADDARGILKSCNIDINSAENGVFLPRSGDPNKNFGCIGQPHQGVHNQEYYRELFRRLDTAKRNDGCSAVKDTLKAIKSELVSGVL